jgi:hypothetical protein
LAAALGGRDIDTHLLKAAAALLAMTILEDLEYLFACLQAVLHERRKDSVLLVAVAKKGAEMAWAREHRPCQSYRSAISDHPRTALRWNGSNRIDNRWLATVAALIRTRNTAPRTTAVL